MKYRTMTVGGLTGNEFEAPDDDAAERHVEAGGDKVLEIIYGFSSEDNVNIVVVAN
jgi:hypothetical protein